MVIAAAALGSNAVAKLRLERKLGCPVWDELHLPHLREASCRPLEVVHIAFPQIRSSAFLSDCLVAFRRNP